MPIAVSKRTQFRPPSQAIGWVAHGYSERRQCALPDGRLLVCDSVQIMTDLVVKLALHSIEEDAHEYRDRTRTGTCDRDFNFGGAKI